MAKSDRLLGKAGLVLGLIGLKLTRLPPELWQLTGLRVLLLYNNKLGNLPPEIGELTALTRLDLHNNQLTRLPPEIGELTALSELDLRHNQLSSLPPEIGKLRKVQRLFLHGNARLGLPDEVLGPTWEDVYLRKGTRKPPREILDAYFRIQGDAGEPLMECKVILVGRGGVGKTSLVKRLSGDPYDPKEPETHGIQITKLKFRGKKGTVLGRVWDFGGQAVLHSMHECFLTARSLYVLVLGERDDSVERDAAYWLQMIRSYAGDVPVVVALNKSAGRQRSFDRDSLARDYGPILGWVATECSDMDPVRGGIAELRQALTVALDSDHMESVRRKFPKKWRTIKDEMEDMTESFVSYEEFQKRCRKNGEEDTKEQAALARDLHDLGIALNYGDKLADLSILRPDWLGDGIYAVLRANQRDKELPDEYNQELAPDGVVDEPRLKLIHEKAGSPPWKMLEVADYPKDKREYLLRLMDLFHLSYPLNDYATVQLVPSLLPLQPPPKGADEPTGEMVTRLRYELPVVPGPLVPWFIAQVFSLIPQRLHWRRGAMLAYGEANAKVWTTPDEKDIFVTVAGPEEDAVRLLALVRAALHRIMAQYKALQVTEHFQYDGDWVPLRTLVKLKVLPESLLPPEPQSDQLAAREDGRDALLHEIEGMTEEKEDA